MDSRWRVGDALDGAVAIGADIQMIAGHIHAHKGAGASAGISAGTVCWHPQSTGGRNDACHMASCCNKIKVLGWTCTGVGLQKWAFTFGGAIRSSTKIALGS